VAAVAEGRSCRSVAKTFMVSVASVVKWSQRQRAVGSPAALRWAAAVLDELKYVGEQMSRNGDLGV
ncbi:MAG: hypothetical protein WA869_06370, partial [Alloacidobacterium sp.]